VIVDGRMLLLDGIGLAVAAPAVDTGNGDGDGAMAFCLFVTLNNSLTTSWFSFFN